MDLYILTYVPYAQGFGRNELDKIKDKLIFKRIDYLGTSTYYSKTISITVCTEDDSVSLFKHSYFKKIITEEETKNLINIILEE